MNGEVIARVGPQRPPPPKKIASKNTFLRKVFRRNEAKRVFAWHNTIPSCFLHYVNWGKPTEVYIITGIICRYGRRIQYHCIPQSGLPHVKYIYSYVQFRNTKRFCTSVHATWKDFFTSKSVC